VRPGQQALTIILYHSIVKRKIFIGFINLFLFPALPGDDDPLKMLQPEALLVVIVFYEHPVRIEEEAIGSG
jgi:hypothetical protein